MGISSVRPHVTSCKPLDGFKLNLILGVYNISYRVKLILVCISDKLSIAVLKLNDIRNITVIQRVPGALSRV
jgi:hypothetical protein